MCNFCLGCSIVLFGLNMAFNSNINLLQIVWKLLQNMHLVGIAMSFYIGSPRAIKNLTQYRKIASIGSVLLYNAPGLLYPSLLLSTTAWMTFKPQSFRGCFDFLLEFETAILSIYLLWIVSMIWLLRTHILRGRPFRLKAYSRKR